MPYTGNTYALPSNSRATESFSNEVVRRADRPIRMIEN